MDFTQFMAAFALAAFWLNTLLIAAAGWSECAGLRRRYAYMTEGTGARRGAVTAADGPEGALAEFTVTQVGRSNGRGPIVFHDRGHAARLLGGRVTLADGEALALPAEAAVEVWISRRALQRAAAPGSGAGHAEVLAAATRQLLPGAGFDLVASCPPYYPLGQGGINPGSEEAIARHELRLPLPDLVRASRRLLGFRGRLALVYPSPRLPELLAALGYDDAAIEALRVARAVA